MDNCAKRLLHSERQATTVRVVQRLQVCHCVAVTTRVPSHTAAVNHFALTVKPTAIVESVHVPAVTRSTKAVNHVVTLTSVKQASTIVSIRVSTQMAASSARV